jgi:hypothetical protein
MAEELAYHRQRHANGNEQLLESVAQRLDANAKQNYFRS